MTLVTPAQSASQLEDTLQNAFLEYGATGYTTPSCRRVGRYSPVDADRAVSGDRVRIEVVTPPEVCDRILSYLRQEVMPHHHVVVSVETFEVLRRDNFEVAPTRDHIAETVATR